MDIKARALKICCPLSSIKSVSRATFALIWRQILADTEPDYAAGQLCHAGHTKRDFPPEFPDNVASPVPVDPDLVFEPWTRWLRRRTRGCSMTTRTTGPPQTPRRSARTVPWSILQPTSWESPHPPNLRHPSHPPPTNSGADCPQPTEPTSGSGDRLWQTSSKVADKHLTARMFFSAFTHCALARIPVVAPQHSCQFRQFCHFALAL